MRVLLVDKEKITKMILPDEISGVFIMQYRPIDSRVTKELTIEAKDGKWILKSNGSLNAIFDNHIESEVELTNYSHFQLNPYGRQELLDLYCLPTIDEHPIKVEVSVNQINIGRSSANCQVIYNDDNILELHSIIARENNNWYINVPKNNNSPVFVNDIAVTNKKHLKAGDIIFIKGLKIIWMQSFMQINNPDGKVMIKETALAIMHDEEYDNSQYEPISEEEANLELYNQNDYFYHTPNLKEYVEEKHIKIDNPPPKFEMEENNLMAISGMITLLSSAFMTGFSLINNILNKAKWQVILPASITFASMIITSMFMPTIMKKYNKKITEKKEQNRKIKYSNYLRKKENEIFTEMKKQVTILNNNNLPIMACLDLLNGSNTKLWTREIKDEDFLQIRVGLGNTPAKIQVDASEESFTLEDDEMEKMVYAIKDSSHELENVPIIFSLLKNKISAIICNAPYKNDYANSIISQIITYHSAADLKIIFFTFQNSDYDFSYAKYIPHVFNEEKDIRFYSDNTEEMKTISAYLEKVLNRRIVEKRNNPDKEKEIEEEKEQQKAYRKYDTYYLIITDDYISAKEMPIIESILKQDDNYGFSFLIFDSTMRKLPIQCKGFVTIFGNSGAVIEKDLNNQTMFTPEYISNIDMRNVGKRLLNIPLQSADELATLPTAMTFLEMFQVSKIEQLNITNRWKTNDPTFSLETPIGVHTNGERFLLNLHEKNHGPHGLIAGSTGSGKSEFIITYVLSMCINYHPDEVQFVLIDYKGGGLAGAFENREKGTAIPHLAGTITNLDTASMNRSLVSINSELKRREQEFMDARDATGESTIDIYKYQKYYREGLVKDPISHLFIIADEFAELKAQQPDFMSELISTARVGRSLGVHLILATQKPSGVVNDQIWSNSKFAICLKVQTTGDSNEMLKRPDAASIKEAGRFYLKVGYDEYFDIGQSGYAGAKYVPSDRTIKTQDLTINFINNTGTIIKSVEDYQKIETSADIGDQLTNIVKSLNEWSKTNNYKPKKLWLDPLPSTIYLDEINSRYSYSPTPYKLEIVIGEYDKPLKQKQGLLKLDLNKGNTYIMGKVGSGKEDLISTIVYSICTNHTPQEINLYIVDMGAGTLRQFTKYPHVGDVCTIDDNEKIIDLMAMAEKEINYRKELTVEFGGSFDSYNELNPDNKLNTMCIIINNLDIFTENLSKIAELIIPLYRDGAKYGVVFIVSCLAVNTIRAKVREYFPNHISLVAANVDDYFNTFTSYRRGLIPASHKGRGLIEIDNEVLEFQTAAIAEKKELNARIKETATQLNEKYQGFTLKSIPAIPKVVNVELFDDDISSLSKVPLGYNAENKEPYYYDFTKNKFNIISANDFTSSIEFLNGLLYLLKKLENNNYDVEVIDFDSYFDILTLGLTCYQSNFNDIFGKIIEESSKISKDTIYIFTGIGKLNATIDKQNLKFVSEFFKNSLNNNLLHFIFIETYNELNVLKIEDWYREVINDEYGIWIGPDVGSQTIIKFTNLTSDDRMIANPEFLVVSEKGKRKIVKGIKLINNEEDEEQTEE